MQPTDIDLEALAEAYRESGLVLTTEGDVFFVEVLDGTGSED
jgi:hypothetical protein